MSIRTVLNSLAKLVSDEAEKNPEFAERLQVVFKSAVAGPFTEKTSVERPGSTRSRPANRRPPAILDPVALALKGEEALRSGLSPLTLDQLKDIVADYGMDREKLVMKWKTPSRVIDKIVEISISRAHKGEAFRS